MTASVISALDRVEASGVQIPGDRIVPFGEIVGVAELAHLLTERIDDLVNIPDRDGKITRSQISTWASRARTTEFPAPLPVRVSRGLLWDRRDFVDPETGRMLWAGPPGRWGISIRQVAEGA